MDNLFENYKKNFANDIYYDKEKISYKEYQGLTPEEKSKCICETSMGENLYYRKIPMELTDEQLKTIIQIESYRVMRDTNSSVHSIKGIIILWFILSIFGFLIFMSSIR